jgi:hypothetical protein
MTYRIVLDKREWELLRTLLMQFEDEDLREIPVDVGEYDLLYQACIEDCDKSE